MSATPPEPPRGRILLVDDSPVLTQAAARILRAAGFEVETASDGRLAATLLAHHPFEAVFSDVSMPNMDGLALLREVRSRDLDLPVVLMTGGPSTQAAITALEHGALRYLLKPVDPGEMARIAREAVLIYRLARHKREALKGMGMAGDEARDLAGQEARLERALASLSLWFDPIVSRRVRACTAFEALCQTEEPGLTGFPALAAAAERLGAVERLGGAVVRAAAQATANLPGDTQLVVPLHPRQLFDPALSAADGPLAARAGRIFLGLPDSARLERPAEAAAQVERLRGRGFRLALTEVGVGGASLSSFGQLGFEMVKLSPLLADGIAAQTTKQKVLVSIVKLYQELGMPVVAGGIKNVADREVMAEAGVDLMQGPYFARPARTFVRPAVRTA